MASQFKTKLADEVTQMNMRQMWTSYQFKIPRLTRIRRFRDLYNGYVPRQWRTRYNAPIPIFSGFIDTLMADLDDDVSLYARETDPADWKAVKKFNSYLEQEQNSSRPGAMWNQKFRMARQECLMTGRGILGYAASSEGGFTSDLFNVPFEDFFFEPKGGGQLENHIFAGQSNIWMTKGEIERGMKSGIYDKEGAKKLMDMRSSDYKRSAIWEDWTFIGRFEALGLSPIAFSYVGEPVFHMVQFVTEFKGQRWYNLFEAFTGTSIRFEKLTDINSSGLMPWFSFASHEDAKNFASKGFADDIYPHAVMMSDFLNEDMENRRRRNSNARAYDMDMFDDVQALDEAQFGRDRLVRVDTKNGTRRIADGLYTFETPEISGTINMLDWMENMLGRNYGVTDLQQGGNNYGSRPATTTALINNYVGKRLSYESQPIIEASKQLGMRVFCGLKDYMRGSLPIKLLGENGFEPDVLRRVDLNTKEDLEFIIESKSASDRKALQQNKEKATAVAQILGNPSTAATINPKAASEFIARSAGFSESEISALLDKTTTVGKDVAADAAQTIQDFLFGRKPAVNYMADYFFLQRVFDYARTHRESLGDKKYRAMLDYIKAHEGIAADNMKIKAMREQGMAGISPQEANPGEAPGAAPTAPGNQPSAPVAPALPMLNLGQ